MWRPEDKVTAHQVEALTGARILAKHHIEAGAVARGFRQRPAAIMQNMGIALGQQ
jgi:hypothetical protein